MEMYWLYEHRDKFAPTGERGDLGVVGLQKQPFCKAEFTREQVFLTMEMGRLTDLAE